MNNNAATIAEVAIVGAGPIGLELGAALKRYGIPYLHFDAGQIGASIGSWPPHTHFYSAPERCAIAGFPAHSIDQNTLTCEHYLAYLRGVVEQLDLPVHVYHKVTDIEQTENGFQPLFKFSNSSDVDRPRRVPNRCFRSTPIPD